MSMKNTRPRNSPNIPAPGSSNPVKHGLTYPPGTKITFEFPARKARGPVKLVWHDGNTTIPKPKDFPADEKVPGTGAILFGDKGMIVHGSHGGANCQLLPGNLRERYQDWELIEWPVSDLI